MKWTEEQVERLVQLYNGGLPRKEIAARFGATDAAIRGRLKRLRRAGRIERRVRTPAPSKPEKAGRPRRSSFWTSERIADLKRLAKAGHTYAEIDEIIGAKPGTSASRAWSFGIRKRPGYHDNRAVLIRANGAAPEATPPVTYDAKASFRIRDAVMALPDRGACKFPIGDLDDEHFHFCGAKATGTYCAEHEKLTRGFTPSPRPRVKERERQSPRVAAGFR